MLSIIYKLEKAWFEAVTAASFSQRYAPKDAADEVTMIEISEARKKSLMDSVFQSSKLLFSMTNSLFCFVEKTGRARKYIRMWDEGEQVPARDEKIFKIASLKNYKEHVAAGTLATFSLIKEHDPTEDVDVEDLS